MTLGDLYPDVRLYSEVETIIMTRGGGSGRTYGKGRRGRRWQRDEERGTGRGVRELSPGWERGKCVCVWGGGEMAPSLQSCAQCVQLIASEH